MPRKKSYPPDIVNYAETDIEKKVVELYVLGKTYEEISKITGVPYGSIGNILRKVSQRAGHTGETEEKTEETEEAIEEVPEEAEEEVIEDAEKVIEDTEEVIEEPDVEDTVTIEFGTEEKEPEEPEVEYIGVPERVITAKLRLSPDIFYKYKVWVAYVNRFGKQKWDGSFEDFLNYAVDVMLMVCKIDVFAVAEVDGKQVRIG